MKRSDGRLLKSLKPFVKIILKDEVVVKKCCEIGYTLDERICDGLYFARSLKFLERYFDDPHLLESGQKCLS